MLRRLRVVLLSQPCLWLQALMERNLIVGRDIQLYFILGIRASAVRHRHLLCMINTAIKISKKQHVSFLNGYEAGRLR
ncbi:hypothetical protein EYF80_010296 [Liparis tanakae]|uniref:Uncharacterized protein n=1 Tax=Liparis tanakae TaxID=230148 RepID=A0A4Z2IQI8_9TELE|nr:hypothetical protein EYF80_010296 [Liparis tanakae]